MRGPHGRALSSYEYVMEDVQYVLGVATQGVTDLSRQRKRN